MKSRKNNYKICLIYDDLIQRGGGEKFFLFLTKIFPNATLYVPIISRYYLNILKNKNIKYSKILSNLAKIPKIGYPIASLFSIFYFEKLKLTEFKTVVSLSNRFAHCVITNNYTTHIAIITSPFRILYKPNQNYILSNIFNYFRIYLQASFKRPDKIIAISSVTKKRLKKYTSTYSLVLNPPLILNHSIEEFKHKSIDFEKDDYILLVGRLVGSKINFYTDVLEVLKSVEFVNCKIVFVGEGQKLNFLKNKYKNVIFTGYLKQENLNYLYQKAKVLIHPQIEDYGLIPLEAMYFNIPIICKERGGVLDYLSKNSVLFYKSNNDLLQQLNLVFKKGYTPNKNKYLKILEIAKPKNYEYNLKNIINNL